MIQNITRVIKEHPEWLRSPEATLSFMKVSTPASGRGDDEGKVILFVFEEGEETPTLCVKTTRVYSHKGVIVRNYENLKLLEVGVGSSECAQMFAKPLYLYDDGENIFSVESVCLGASLSGGLHEVQIFLEKYSAWQELLSRTVKNFLQKEDIHKIAHNLIKSLGLSKSSEGILADRYSALFLDENIKLPVIVQHGDMTPDNVLVNGKNISFIDYDYVSDSYLPGFDLFNLLLKVGVNPSSFEQYFSVYFQKIGAGIKSYNAIFFIYCLQEIKRKERVDDHSVIEKVSALFDSLGK